MRIRSRREEGQAYPALLLAVVGGFAIAVSFVPLQNLLDQTGRADTASDSAALAAAKAHKPLFLLDYQSHPHEPATNLADLMRALNMTRFVFHEADQLATANGAHAVSVTDGRFRLGSEPRWIYEVITEQNDTVKGGDASVNSKSRARAALIITAGLCQGGIGAVTTSAGCKGPVDWAADCIPLPNKPPLPYCYEDLTANMEFEIKLVQNNSLSPF